MHVLILLLMYAAIQNTVTAGSSCRDVENVSDCQQWKGWGFCEPESLWWDWMKEKCERTCALCTRQEESPLLITTGQAECPNGARVCSDRYEVGSNDSQVITVTFKKKCKDFPPYPIAVKGASGAVVKNRPIVCGGSFGEKRPLTKKCFIHDLYLNKWIFLTNMPSNRAYHQSVAIDDALWVVSGWDGKRHGNGIASSTEFIYPDGRVVKGPSLPSRMYATCMVTLHDGRILILGGKLTGYGTQVLFYDPKRSAFTEGPSLINGKSFSGCAVFRSPLHQNRHVVVAAGSNYEHSAEFLDYTVHNSWEKAPDLPADVRDGTLLPTSTGDGVIGLFYGDDADYMARFQCDSTKCEWRKIREDIKVIHQDAVVMYLPSQYSC